MNTQTQEYTFNNFLSTLDDAGHRVAEAIHDHIANHYPEYKPFDIRPTNNTCNEWMLNFRIKPKTGQAFCTMYSFNSKFMIRIISNDYELHLRRNEFNDKIRRFITMDFCKNCKNGCEYQWRQHYYFDGQIKRTARANCPSVTKYSSEYGGYGNISDLNDDDIKDLLYLIDIKAKYASKPKDPRNICGNDYAETSRKRCGSVEIMELEQIELDIDDFRQSDYANPKKLDKYSESFNLTSMGASNDGLWYFHDDKAVCGMPCDDYNYTAIPEGRYAAVTISDPFTFSAWRAWNYTAKWILENNINIRPAANLVGQSAPFFVKFNRQGIEECLSVYVPIE